MPAWIPYSARIGHPSMSIHTSPASGSLMAVAATPGSGSGGSASTGAGAGQQLASGPALHAVITSVNQPSNPPVAVPCEMGLVDSAMTIRMPPLSALVMPPAHNATAASGAAAVGSITPAPSSGASGATLASSTAAPVPVLPKFRVFDVQPMLGGFPIGPPQRVRYYDPAPLSVSAVNPKKLVQGGEISLAIAGLDALLDGKDGLAPLPGEPGGGGTSPRPATKAAGKTSAAAAPAPAPAPVAADPDRVPQPVPPASLSLLVQVSIGGTQWMLPGKIADGAVTASLVAPATGEALPVGDGTVAVSVDGGITFTPAALLKIVKK